VFRGLWDLDESAMVVGAFRGSFASDRGGVRLLRPVEGEAPSAELVVVDELHYGTGPDRLRPVVDKGLSLNRVSEAAFADFGTSWRASEPTPGTASFSQPGDMDGNGLVDEADVGALVLALRDPLSYEATYGLTPVAAGDIDRDGDVDYDDIAGLVARTSQLLDANRGSGRPSRFGSKF
jgi:hypothetical protein